MKSWLPLVEVDFVDEVVVVFDLEVDLSDSDCVFVVGVVVGDVLLYRRLPH